MPETRATKRCPTCAEDVWAEAQICRYCRHDFSADRQGEVDVPARAPDGPVGTWHVLAPGSSGLARNAPVALVADPDGLILADPERSTSVSWVRISAHRLGDGSIAIRDRDQLFVRLAPADPAQDEGLLALVETRCSDSQAQAGMPLPGVTTLSGAVAPPARDVPPRTAVAAQESAPDIDPEENLSATVREAMADGWAPAYADARSAVLHRGSPISHVLHGIVSWPLAFWFWYWVYITLRHGGVHQMHITAQRDGSVVVREAPERTPRWVYVEWVALAAFQIWFTLAVYLPAVAATPRGDPYAAQGVFLPGTETAPPAAEGHVSVLVGATEEAGVVGPTVAQGDRITISASGTWCTAGCGTPGGWRTPDPRERNPVLSSSLIGTLIARIGDGPWFAVGTGTTVDADRGGALLLAVNDLPGTYGDNKGAVVAEIAVGQAR